MKTTYDRILNYGLDRMYPAKLVSKRSQILTESKDEKEYLKRMLDETDGKVFEFAYQYAQLKTLEQINGKLLYFVILSVLGILASVIVALISGM
jgi:hypothetical protein